VLFQQQLRRDGVDPARIVAFNLEDPDTEREFGTGLVLYERVKALATVNQPLYVFIDEPQHLAEPERTIAGLALLKGVDLYITGSNSSFLAGDFATRLTGRFVDINVLPLSFAEYAPYHAQVLATTSSTRPADAWRAYLKLGGFPYAARLGEDQLLVREYLRGVLNTITLRDVAPRQSSFSPTLFDSVLGFALDNIGNLSTVKRISDTLTSLGRKTGRSAVESYLTGLVESYVLYPARRYDIKGKVFLEHSAKYYAVDHGLRRAYLGTRHPDWGHVLENIVFLELLRRRDQVSVGRINQAEVDFLANGDEGLAYVQVSQSVADPAVLERELAPLRAIPDHYPRLLLVGDD